MHAAIRFVSEYGCKFAIASARKPLVPLYEKFGFVPNFDAAYTVGEQTFVPGCIRANMVQAIFEQYPICWDLPFHIEPRQTCTHGNGSTNDSRAGVVRADVLDACYPPASRVRCIRFDADTIRRTPPDPDALISAISQARGIPKASILPGPGSSALMYAVFPQWFSQSSHVLLVTPTYAEYPHILREIGCTVHEVSETMDVREVIRGSRYDGIVIVNPNSPSGRYVEDLQSVLEQVDITTRVWVDETYIDYVRADDGTSMSIERFASTTINVTVCKSMSKYYALSGARVAYLVAHPMVLSGIVSPPWWVPAYTQRLAVAALESEEYYRAESRHVRKNLQYMIDALQAMGFTVVGTPRASFATFTVMGVDATQVVDALKAKGVYVRLAVGYPNAIRIAAQNRRDTLRLVSCLQDVYNA